MGNTFHQATVTHKHIGVVIYNGVRITSLVSLIEPGCKHLLGDSHAHGISQSLPQRSGRGFHPGCITVLWMPRCFRSNLSEILQLIHRQVITCEVQQRIEQHGAMTVGQNKPVPIAPVRISGIVF